MRKVCLLAISYFVLSSAVHGAERLPSQEAKSSSKSRIVSYLGINVVRSLGWGIGAQYAWSASIASPWHFGADVNYALFSPGSLLTVQAGAWYDVRISGAPSLGVSAGLLSGVGFAGQLPGIGSTALASYLDFAITQEVSPTASIRGQIRPGFVGGYFALMMNLAIAFRFI